MRSWITPAAGLIVFPLNNERVSDEADKHESSDDPKVRPENHPSN
jgi:hypothetical protein